MGVPATSSGLHVRVREAHAGDKDFLAWAILSASRGHRSRGTWEFIWNQLDRKELGRFLAAVATSKSPHWCHHSRFLVAELDGRPVAGMSAFDPTCDGPTALAMATLTVAGDFGIEGSGLIQSLTRARRVQQGIPEYVEGGWAIENVASLPEARGQGVVSALLERALEEGRSQGFRVAQVNFFVGNAAAEKLYRAKGFSLDLDHRTRAFQELFGTPGMVRYTRPLGG